VLQSLRKALLANDPRGRALGRGLRVALVVPVTMAVLLQIPWVSQGALMGAFASLALLVFADFGGPLRQRFTANIVTTLAGVPLLVLGAYAGQNVWTSVAAMALVAMVIGLLGVLRGLIAAAQSVLLLATVLAITASTPALLGPDLVCWLVGGLAAALSAVLLWPTHSKRPIRRRVADVLDAVADASEARWIQGAPPDELEPLRAHVNDTVAALHTDYDGNLLRPSGVTSSDRALAQLVDETTRLRYLQKWEDVADHTDPELQSATAELCRRVVVSLRRCAERLRDHPTEPLSSADMFEIRGSNLDAMSDWLADKRGHEDPTALRTQIDDTFPVRITTLITSRITDQTIHIAGRPGDVLADPPGTPTMAALRPPSIALRLRAHFAWTSPWFRNAVRSAVALSISIAVAKSVSLEHPFWIVLGTLSALRFDAMGTGRTARQALVGTTAGVVLSVVCILLIGDNTAIWWALFPLALFWAAYTPGTLSYAIGQAGFSFVVIVMFSIMAPARLDTATARLIDVALGLGISLLVSLLMWPRGVAQTLYARLAQAIQQTCDFYVASVDWMAGGAIDERQLNDYRRRSHDALDRAQEALDLSIAQQPPKSVPLQRFTALANTAGHVDFAARLFPQAEQIVAMRGGEHPIPGPLVGPLLRTSNGVREQLVSLSEEQDRGDTPFTGDLPTFTTSPDVAYARAAIDAYLAGPGEWQGTGSDPRPVVATWLTDWSALFDRTAQLLRARA